MLLGKLVLRFRWEARYFFLDMSPDLGCPSFYRMAMARLVGSPLKPNEGCLGLSQSTRMACSLWFLVSPAPVTTHTHTHTHTALDALCSRSSGCRGAPGASWPTEHVPLRIEGSQMKRSPDCQPKWWTQSPSYQRVPGSSSHA